MPSKCNFLGPLKVYCNERLKSTENITVYRHLANNNYCSVDLVHVCNSIRQELRIYIEENTWQLHLVTLK